MLNEAEMRLVAMAVGLGATACGGPLSDGERALVEEARLVGGTVPRLAISQTRRLIKRGADPLPHRSADHLRTLIGGNLGVKQPDSERAERAASLIRAGWDQLRFPWLVEQRPATKPERDTAILWTASIWAIESMRTHQRLSSSKAQEKAVANALMDAGFQQVPRRALDVLEKLDPGTFTGECRLGNNKCDVPIRLRDGRLLAVECKVSNTAVNSKKRLNDSGGAKAKDWRDLFGAQVISAVVLSGVYSLGNLVTAQNDQRITIFWAHDLDTLVRFVKAAG